MSIYLLPLLIPFLFAAAGVAASVVASPRSGARIAEWLALGALAVAVAGMAILVARGAGSDALFAPNDLFPIISVRLDAVSAVMLLLVAFVGWVVLRYSVTYMDGEPRHRRFTALLCGTLASILLLVQSGNLVQLLLAWIASSLFLHRLLLFYPERVTARRAAHKKFVTARFSDLAVAGVAVLLVLNHGTTDIATILDEARGGGATFLAVSAAALLAMAALLKSAQFPTHGWLTEVMEAPTPVSALLHAGLINAGGFLLIRFADVMLLSPGVLAVLVFLGGFTAIFGSVVMLTQPAVKTSLAWSTVAQMGFMIFQCGLALFPLALLHIVAHSLYKAHAFLAAGGAVEGVASIRRAGPIAVPDGAAVSRAFLVALSLYVVIGAVFGMLPGGGHKSPQAYALGAILIFGVAYLLAQGLAGAAPRFLRRRMAMYAVATSVAYFALQRLTEELTTGTLPATPAPGALEWALIVLAVTSFGAVAFAQSMFPNWAFHPAAAGLRVHLANGLYANAIFDRLLDGWTVRQRS